jgi:hypothetical protein
MMTFETGTFGLGSMTGVDTPAVREALVRALVTATMRFEAKRSLGSLRRELTARPVGVESMRGRACETRKTKALNPVDFSNEFRALHQSGRQDLNLRPLGPEATSSVVQPFARRHKPSFLALELGQRFPAAHTASQPLLGGLLLMCC